ncbi:hypothetical protein UY3_11576 [Chelonia mydas]|uniref:Uncharacterized protein n=1 Tax=Chelonia mydas TaxID=8469 RepID=M7BT96_CHEMY|nr:hypothetical protein UY3_11576 [Chelonia mydas]
MLSGRSGPSGVLSPGDLAAPSLALDPAAQGNCKSGCNGQENPIAPSQSGSGPPDKQKAPLLLTPWSQQQEATEQQPHGWPHALDFCFRFVHIPAPRIEQTFPQQSKPGQVCLQQPDGVCY